MKRVTLIVIIFFLTCNIIFTQGEFYTINHDTKVILYKSKNEKSDNFYLLEDYRKLNIYLKDSDKPLQKACRVDIKNRCLEIVYNDVIYDLPYFRIDSFFIEDISNKETTAYYNGLVYHHTTADLLLELLNDSNSKLFRSYGFKIKKSNYNPVTITGSKEDIYIKQDFYYLYNPELGLLKVPTKKKEFRSFTAKYMINYEKQKRKLNPKNLDDLIFLCNNLKINKKS